MDAKPADSRVRPLLRWLRRSGIVLAMVVVAVLGGVATTKLWPVTVETQLFSLDLSLSPLPSQANTVHTPTVLGDINVTFDGPLPALGIDAQAQVGDEAAAVLNRPGVTVNDFQPSEMEIGEAAREGAIEVVWKFGAGALVTSSLMAALWVLGRRHHRWGRAGIAVVTATGVALALPGGAALLTYRQSNFSTFTTTSLLSTFGATTTVLTDLNSRAEQAAPYLQNLLALSEAARNEFTPDDLDASPAARFLLVSDLHGVNYYPLIKQIVDEQNITAVIDTGDIINFGRVQEAEVADLFAGIESLGVPYVYVGGNHDATSPDDESMLRAMNEIPNVVLVEPTAGEFYETEIAGVRIVGYNDVRYFGEEGVDYGADQQAALDSFEQVLEATIEADPDGREPDIVISHEPYALENLDVSGVTINGHMHRPTLDGNHIGVGTFSGGGLFNHFIYRDAEGVDTAGELPGQPYSFDILDYTSTCRLTSLTRFSYSNLVTGTPQFDDVSLINGARLIDSPPQDRTCGGEDVMTRELGPVGVNSLPGESRRLPGSS